MSTSILSEDSRGGSLNVKRYGAAVDVSALGAGGTHANALRCTLSLTRLTPRGASSSPANLFAGLETSSDGANWEAAGEFPRLAAPGSANLRFAAPLKYVRAFWSTDADKATLTVDADVS